MTETSVYLDVDWCENCEHLCTPLDGCRVLDHQVIRTAVEAQLA
ncbi:MAG TPA: hypothetical protein VFF67_10320 [Thermoplasmata archaeon]|nr:hypothetical protein [Thermoplasmata archaeon]